MAALPYMPLFVADYLADTAHLTTIQHGAYLLLIMNYWQRGKPLPNDDARLARIAGLSVRNWQQIKGPVVEMFDTGTESLYHPRIEAELDRVRVKSLKSKKAAQASVQRRFGGRSTDVEPTEAHTDTESSEDKSSGGEPPDPVKELFDIGVSILVAADHTEKQARSLVGKWRKSHADSEVLAAFVDCRSRAITNPVEWLTKRLAGSDYVSPSGYKYRGDAEAVMREAEKRADWSTYWKAKADMEQAA